MKDFYVYAHYKPGEDRPFYVGKGVRNRYRLKHGRITWWHSIVAKYFPETKEPITKFLAKDLDEQLALDLEVFWIALYGRIGIDEGGCLVNRWPGGDLGRTGLTHTPETKAKMAVKATGRKHDEATLKRMSASHIGKSPSNKGVAHTEETKRKLSIAGKGRVPPNKGVPCREESKKKISLSLSKFMTKENRDAVAVRNGAKPIKFLSPEGEIVEVVNITDFARSYNLSRQHLGLVKKGIRPSHKGWTLYINKNTQTESKV